MSVKRINEFTAKESKGAELGEFLASITTHVRTLPGCISCEFYKHGTDALRYIILEEWESVEVHQQAAKHIPPEMMQQAMSLFGAPPRGTYYNE